MNRHGFVGEDRGETLVEVLMSVTILGIATAGVLGLLQTSIGASDIHHKQSVGGSILDNFAEYMLDEASAPYTVCPAAVTAYDTNRSTFESQLDTASSKVFEPDYVVGGTARYTLSMTVQGGELQAPGSDPTVVFSGTCAGAELSGLQQLNLTVASVDTKATESTVIVKRRP
jgi:type II secretory pathway pseudopilin PulG